MRFITKLWATLLLLCVAGVANAATEYEIDQKFTSVAALDGQLFAIVNETDGKAIYNKDAQNLAYDTYANAIAGTAYLWKIHSLAEESDALVQNAYAIEVVNADGSSIGLWGNPAIYLNSGKVGGFDGCFVLGQNNQYGTDVKYGGAWEIEYAEGQGFALKNVARGGYFAGVNPAPTGTEPIYWTFCTMKEKPQTDPLAEQKDALTAAIATGKMYFAVAYTEATFSTLTTAITDGETALAAEGATAESLTNATTAINNAIAALALKDGFSNLTAEKFMNWDSATEPYTAESTGCAYELFKPSGLPYGDGNVGWKNFALLSDYDKLYVTFTEGTPRIMMNRDVDGGQWNETEAESHLIEFPKGDAVWSAKYFTNENGVITVDLKQIVADKGFANLNAIKGANWANVTVTGLFLYKEAAAPVETVVTFDFNASNHATSANGSNAGDITEAEENTIDGVVMTISPATSGTPNRYWSTNNGPQLRMYSGTMTIVAPEGKAITKVVINQGKWNNENQFNGVVSEESTWTGNSTNFVFDVAGNTQMNSIAVTIADANTETTTYGAVAEKPATPTFTPAAGEYNAAQNVTIACETEGAAIYYTLDGTAPTAESTLYTEAIAIAETTTVKAIAIKDGEASDVAEATYTINLVEPVIAEGKYYLLNVAADGYVVGANDWGTRASITKQGGIEFEASMTSEGKYELKSEPLYPNKHLGFNGYVDNDAAANWTIAPVEGKEGLFTLSTDGTNVLFWDGGEATTTSVGAMPEVVENAYWQFVPADERLAMLKKANAENPVDATFLIQNPDFGRASNKGLWQGDDYSIGGPNENFNAEKWGGNSQLFDVHQKITLPNGVYKLTWNGFYRYNNTTDNTNDIAAAAHAAGTEVINSFVYANDTTFALTSIADEASVATYGKMPFSQAEAAEAFGMGAYEKTVDLIISADSLVLGVKKIEHLGTDWTVWDNFRLTYYGVVVNDDDPEVQAPEGWINLIANGNLATDNVANFVAKEAPSADIVGATIVPGAGKNNSRGLVVKSADEVGKEGAQDWDTQFWIKVNEPLVSGSKLHVEFDYAASKAARAGTQAHGEPGAYQHWAMVGDVNFTTEWQHFSQDIEINDAMAKGDNGNGNGIGLISVAFNLAVERTAVEYYFDNFGLWYQKPVIPESWTDLIVNGNMEGESMECFYVTEQGVGGPFVAVATDGIGKDGGKAVKVQSADNAGTDWDSQFFIRLPYQLPAGTRYKVSFDYKADKEGGFDTQAHAEPGQYIHWAFCGSGNFTTEWQTYEKEGTVPAECDGSENKNPDTGEVLFLKTFQTIAFNLAKNKVATEFIFDNVKFEVPTDVVSSLTLNPAVDPQPYPTGIKSLMSDKNAEGVYNLNGQKVNVIKKGLYIQNGRKVVKK